MKITFDNMNQIDQNTVKTDRSLRSENICKAYVGQIQVAFDGKDRVAFGTDIPGRSKGNSFRMQEDAVTQVQNMRNQMTVLSHTMSDEDFARMQKEGYDPAKMDPEEAVTILDKIKAELMKAGEHIAGFTDNVDMTTLAAAVGDEALAASLRECFEQYDIPVEKENVEQVLWAMDIAKGIKEPTDSTYYFMASNGMEATLTDFYVAGASGSRLSQIQSTGYFAEEINGYITKNVEMVAGEEMDTVQEVTRLLEKLGIPVEEETTKVALWMVEKGLPVDVAGIERMGDILAVTFPLDGRMVMEKAAEAISEGIPVGEKNLVREGYRQKALDLVAVYQSESAVELVQDRRQLEEIRLRMTVETNVKLLKSGFAIETAPIEETIAALKQVEQDLARQYFPQAENAEAKYQLYEETNRLMKELPTLPLATAGKWAERLQEGTLQEFYEAGKMLAEVYRAAGERYETMATAPRADLGDHIQKAFANVDEILKDLNYEATEENRKALRALGYNRMEITSENVERVKEALRSVEQVIEKMTPAAVLKMIRDEVNPLEETLPKLRDYLDRAGEEFPQTAEKYSKFLYQLQKQGEITPQEREAFIGCYRMLHQLEKSDGAAVGALLNVGGELNFKNLLTAVRSRRLGTLDVKVSDALGQLTEEAVLKFSISEQIEQAYKKEEAARNRQLLKEASEVCEESFQMIERAQLSPTPENLMAAHKLEQSGYSLFEQLLRPGHERLKKTELWKKLEKKDDFRERYEEDLADTLSQVEENLDEDSGQVDVRNRKLCYKQLHIMQRLTNQEEYYFPMEIKGQVVGVHLQFESGKNQQGQIRMTLESAVLGRISGRLQVTEHGVEGYFVGNHRETVMKLKGHSDIITNSISKEWTFCEIEFVYSETDDIPMDWTRRSPGAQVSNEKLYSLAKEFLQVTQAVGEA